jgi:hypothetical protein
MTICGDCKSSNPKIFANAIYFGIAAFLVLTLSARYVFRSNWDGLCAPMTSNLSPLNQQVFGAFEANVDPTHPSLILNMNLMCDIQG